MSRHVVHYPRMPIIGTERANPRTRVRPLVGRALGGLLLAALTNPSTPFAAAGGAPETVPETPAVAPVLPDFEWLISGALALDALPKSSYRGETRTADLRRARVGGAALWHGTWAISVGADLAHSGTLGQASLAYYGLPVHFEVGRFPEPFGLIQQEVSAGQMLMELPMSVALAPAYGLGVAASLAGPRHTLAVGAFAPTPAADRIQHRAPEQAATVRATAVPFRTGSSLVHLGTAFSLRNPRDETIRFAAIPETVLLSDLVTASAPLMLRRYSIWGLELGALSGPLLLQGEGIFARLPDTAAGPMTFSGGHVEAGWTFGAESRGYRSARGVFGPVYSSRPLGAGGNGAMEVAARYSFIDLTSNRLGDKASPALRDLYSGERATVRTLGINWYATDDVKLSFGRLDIENETRSEIRRVAAYQGRVHIQFTAP